MRTIKERLAAGEIINTFAVGRFVDPVIVEMFALAGGYQAFWIDQEHVNSSSQDVYATALAGRANGLDSFVRMAPTGYSEVTQYLEIGVGGVMAAQINSADHAREFTSWVKFPPSGTRGLNTGGYDADYTHLPPADFVEVANQRNFVAIQIETLGALNDADEIAAIPDVDLLFVGPSDLSLQLGVCGQFHHEKLWEAIAKVAAACASHGKHWGAVVPDPEFCDKAMELDCAMPTMGNGVVAIRRGIQALQTAFAKRFN